MKHLQTKLDVAKTSKISIPEAEKKQLIREYQSCPKSSGRTNYLKYLNDESLTHKEAALAKCAECCCGYDDGRVDCETPTCPLYIFMPYRKDA